MKNMTNFFIGSTLSALVINGVISTAALADQWQTRAEQKEVNSQITSSDNSQAVKQSAQTDSSFLKHKPVASVSAGERLQIKAKVQAKDGVKVARVYFKAAEASRYSFVVLNKGPRNVYVAELPATANSVSSIEYKIVVQNAFGEIYKTDKYKVPVSPSGSIAQQQNANSGFIDVYSEHPEDSGENSGFVDKVRYTYGATKLATSLGQALSVANSGSGYVGGASSSAGGASAGSAAATTGATTSTASLGAAAAVGAGVVGASAVADPSGIEGNDMGARKVDSSGGECFGGIIEISITSGVDDWIQRTEFRNGLPYSASVSTGESGCLTENDIASDDVEELEFPSGFCVTTEMVDMIIEEGAEGVSYKIVDNHSCPVIYFF